MHWELQHCQCFSTHPDRMQALSRKLFQWEDCHPLTSKSPLGSTSVASLAAELETLKAAATFLSVEKCCTFVEKEVSWDVREDGIKPVLTGAKIEHVSIVFKARETRATITYLLQPLLITVSYCVRQLVSTIESFCGTLKCPCTKTGPRSEVFTYPRLRFKTSVIAYRIKTNSLAPAAVSGKTDQLLKNMIRVSATASADLLSAFCNSRNKKAWINVGEEDRQDGKKEFVTYTMPQLFILMSLLTQSLLSFACVILSMHSYCLLLKRRRLEQTMWRQ